MVIWSESAKNDLKQIHDYISRDSKYYAKKAVQSILEKTASIELHPGSGRIVPELSDNNVREIFQYSYRIVYEISEDDIAILAIVHAKRDFDTAFMDKE